MKLVLASKNKKKLVEMNEILSHLGTEVCSEAEAGVDVEVEETGTTFEENSLLKARAVMEASGLPPLPTTPGLCVDALNGAPGGVLRPLRRRGAGRYRPLLAAAGEHERPDAPDGKVCVRYHLLLPQWGRAHRPGGVPGTIAFAPRGRAASAMTRCFSCRR